MNALNKTAIAGKIDEIIEALRAKDLDALARVYAADVVSFDIDPPLQHVGLPAKLKNWEKVFTVFQDLNYEVRGSRITSGEDVAFAYGFGRLSGTLVNGAATNGMWVRATFCLEKRDGDWVIVHDQVSVPFDVASGKGVADLEP
jgi:ketosteroid isomerase-like protein